MRRASRATTAPPIDAAIDSPAAQVPDPSGARLVSVRPASGIRMLTVPAEFERCLSRAPIVRSGAFALHVAAPAEAPDLAAPGAAFWRLGLVIPKRYEASAVARNTIKRRWRAAFAATHVACAAEFGATDLVVRMQSALVGKRAGSPPAAAPATARTPAVRRARAAFDPQAILGMLAERLRKGGIRPAGVVRSLRP